MKGVSGVHWKKNTCVYIMNTQSTCVFLYSLFVNVYIQIHVTAICKCIYEYNIYIYIHISKRYLSGLIGKLDVDHQRDDDASPMSSYRSM